MKNLDKSIWMPGDLVKGEDDNNRLYSLILCEHDKIWICYKHGHPNFSYKNLLKRPYLYTDIFREPTGEIFRELG